MASNDTDVSICSAALLLVGANEITSFSDVTQQREAKICASLYPVFKDRLLTDHPWRFSIDQAQLAQLVDEPLFGFEHAYQLPSNLIRLFSTESDRNYKVYGNKIFSNETELKINYQFSPVESKMPTYFVNALLYEMAANLALSLAEDEGKYDILEKKAQFEKRKAKNIDSQQQPNPVIRSSQFHLIFARG